MTLASYLRDGHFFVRLQFHISSNQVRFAKAGA
jgi:hypothetical protein